MPIKPIHVVLLAAVATSAAAQTAALATLHSFQGNPSDGASPRAGVIIGANGSLYGTTYGGGANICTAPALDGCGAVYELAPPAVAGGAWTETLIYSFRGCCVDATIPTGGLVLGSHGVLYGATDFGGVGNGNGAVFQLTPPATAGAAWTESVLYSVNDDRSHGPAGSLLLGQNGTLYGANAGRIEGDHTYGAAVFALSPPAAPGGNWTESTLYAFDKPTGGTNPRAGLVANQGALLGTDYYGGSQSCGKIGCGAVFELQPLSTAGPRSEVTLYSFTGPPLDGANPTAALTVGRDGVLYGTTLYGGSGALCIARENGTVVSGCGAVFQLTPPAAPGGTWTETVLYSFTGLNGDGAYPAANLILGENGSLYGTTQYGGSATSGSPCTSYGATGCGTVFEMMPPTTPGGTWTETVLYSFTGASDGANPTAPLLLSASGVLYGTTSAGGTAGWGTVFSLTLN